MCPLFMSLYEVENQYFDINFCVWKGTEKMQIPNHVAIILDGNGRWAKAHGKPRTFGHVQGAKTVEDMCEITYNMGINYFTVYAFSTENWSRPADEVAALMKLLRNYMVNCKKRANQNNMCVRVIGDKTHSPHKYTVAAGSSGSSPHV